jgi:UDP-N-acetylmuramoyl-tripeptide--D-alanyl-D-alanine ligase
MNAPLWTFEDFLAAMKGRPVGVKPEVVSGISIDSRTVEPGEAFFAIQGDRFDGHNFTTRALSGGAVTAVVAESRLAAMGRISGSLTVVSDVLEALGDLGRAARARSDANIVAITGSVGKTGTKEMLARALEPNGPVHFSPASFNNHWGVPLTLARLPIEASYGVFEIGMNHAGEIEPLVKMVRPHAAIVTTVEPVHLEYFNDVKEIARAKGEIFNGLEPGGAAIINRDNPHYGALARMARKAGADSIVAFGAHGKSDAWLEKVALKEDCSCVSATILGEPVSYKIGAPGRHLVQNSLAVLAAVAVVGGDLAKAALSLAELVAPEGRGTRHRLVLGQDDEAEAILIDESYNANPASMRAAIALLGQQNPGQGGRRIAVLGDMRELGENAAALHGELAEALAKAKVDSVFMSGPLMAALRDALPSRHLGGYAESASELEPLVFDSLAPGDVVMVKGSNASRMGALVEAMKTRFAARQAAANNRQGQEIA